MLSGGFSRLELGNGLALHIVVADAYIPAILDDQVDGTRTR